MGKFKRIVAVCLVVMLGVTTLAGCGHKEQAKSEAPKRATLKSSVTVAVAEGDAFTTVGKLSGDVKVSQKKNQQQVMNELSKGKCDFAVLTPIEAARYYNQYGKIKVVTTLALGDWDIAVRDYEGEPVEEDLVKLGGQRLLGIKEEPLIEEEPVIVEEPEEEPDQEEPEESLVEIEPKEMGEEVFQTLMAKEKYGFYDGQINWMLEKDIVGPIGDSYVLGSTHKVTDMLKGNESYKLVYSLGELWTKEFDSSVPAYVLVATDKFLKERGDEVEGLLDVISDNVDESQGQSPLNLVAYNYSNRGVMLVRDFLDVMAKYNSNAIDDQEVSVDFYWNGK